ncbi:MAG: response regulator [Nitrospira sp.]|nr:MAG: response regulator [Nitrospira sp.]
MHNDDHLQLRRTVPSPVRRMTLAISAILLVVVAGYGGLFIHSQQKQVRMQAEEQGRVLARGYAAIGASALFENLFMLQSAFIQVKNQHDIQRIMMLDPDHMIVASDITTLIGTTLNDQAGRNAEQKKEGAVFSGSEIGLSDDTIVVFEPLYRDPLHRTGTENVVEGKQGLSPTFAGWIRIEISMKRLQAEAWQSLVQQALVMALLAAAMIFIVSKTIQRLSHNLENSEAKLQKTIDTALDAVVTTDAAGTVTAWNAQAETIFGWSEQEALGRPLDSLVIPVEGRDGYRRELARFLEARETQLLTQRLELTAVRKEGGEFPVEWSMSPIWVHNECKFSSFIRDITERKKAEEAQVSYRMQLEREVTMRTEALEALRQAKDLAESASRAKSDFLAHMSHEIRTPMNGILGMTELLLQTELSGKQHHFVNTVYRSGSTLLRLINDVLDFSKVEAGKVELEHIRFDLVKTVREVTDLFVEQAQGKGINLTCVLAESVPSVLQGDPVRLQQILMNLVNNAVKFTKQGSIALTVTMAEASASHALVRFEVQDSGVGIEPAAQAKIFEAFSQADGSTARKYGGTGLGLSIVKQLAQLMEGAVGVRSEPGQGATFWCTARLEKVSGNTREGRKRSTSRRGDVVPYGVSKIPETKVAGARVLLAEDNPVNREVAVCMLEQLGCQVVAVEHGRDAVAKTECARFDVVLMDCQMPEMDGLSATTAIRDGERRTGWHVPIVALTAHAIDGDRERCLAAGMDDYMTKPFTQGELGNMIQQWVRRPGDEAAATSDQSRAVPAEPLQSPSEVTEEGTRQAPVLTLLGTPLADQVLDQIRALRRPGRPDPVAKILTSFLESSATYVSAIHQAVVHQDAEALSRAAHALKSSSAMIGAMELSKILKDFESMGRQSDLAGCQARMAELDTVYEAVRQAVLNELGKKTA